jgi:hypothetical protein
MGAEEMITEDPRPAALRIHGALTQATPGAHDTSNGIVQKQLERAGAKGVRARRTG